MIRVTKMDGKSVVINPDLLLLIESTPDTLISLTTGMKILVREPVENIVTQFMEYKRKINNPEKLKEVA